MKKFFKIIGAILVAMSILIAGISIYYYFENQFWRGQEDSVSITIEYSEEKCNKDRPLSVQAINGSDYVVNLIEWDVGIFNPGYSTDLVTRGYHEYSHDKILKPGEKWEYCQALPKTDGAIRVKTFKDSKSIHKALLYTIKNKNIKFHKNA
jgi:hypothetical protein